jgi:hypothetical protein
MRVLTLRQPWASLVASGAKSVEVRSWTTPYRGPVAILAGRGRDREAGRSEYPAGHLLCVVDVLDVRPLAPEDREATTLSDARFDAARAAGCYAWVLSTPRPCAPVEMRGTLGLVRPSPAVAGQL